jgi:hypothetical protein
VHRLEEGGWVDAWETVKLPQSPSLVLGEVTCLPLTLGPLSPELIICSSVSHHVPLNSPHTPELEEAL